ncbi:MAG TPA: hypothetical protein PLJ21_10630 [Pseudobdellovibrionaceae bacterium]|nr:hypothetical protein [Pseudobdellovibrionaceae bacterium]
MHLKKIILLVFTFFSFTLHASKKSENPKCSSLIAANDPVLEYTAWRKATQKVDGWRRAAEFLPLLDSITKNPREFWLSSANQETLSLMSWVTVHFYEDLQIYQPNFQEQSQVLPSFEYLTMYSDLLKIIVYTTFHKDKNSRNPSEIKSILSLLFKSIQEAQSEKLNPKSSLMVNNPENPMVLNKRIEHATYEYFKAMKPYWYKESANYPEVIEAFRKVKNELDYFLDHQTHGVLVTNYYFIDSLKSFNHILGILEISESELHNVK